MSEKITKDDAPYLTDEELEEVRQYLEKGGDKISPTTAEKFFNLYEAGRSIEDISESFPAWPKEALQLARIEHSWDEKKEKKFIERIQSLPRRLAQAKLDMVEHLVDQVAVANLEFKKQMEVYMQNPTPDNLPQNRITGLKAYREAIAALNDVMKLGEEAEKQEGNGTTVNVYAGESRGNQVIEVLDKKEKASLLTKAISSDEKKDVN